MQEVDVEGLGREVTPYYALLWQPVVVEKWRKDLKILLSKLSTLRPRFMPEQSYQEFRGT